MSETLRPNLTAVDAVHLVYRVLGSLLDNAPEEYARVLEDIGVQPTELNLNPMETLYALGVGSEVIYDFMKPGIEDGRLPDRVILTTLAKFKQNDTRQSN